MVEERPEEAMAMPEIIVTLGDNVVNKYVFEKDVISIGRSRDNDVCVENLAVSRNHARIRRENGSFIISDLNSANGTFVNGVRVQKTEIFNDDVITIGKHKLLFKNVAMTDEALISDAFGAERTMIMDKVPTAYLVITRGKQKDMEFKIDKAETTIGRSADCEIRLHDWFVSKQHAVIHRQGNSFLLRDPGSWKGTRVNDVQVTETVLQDGDEIQVGGTRLQFRIVTEEARPTPDARVPLELERPEPEHMDVYAEPTSEEPLEGLGAEPEEEPIRAGGADDFIEPSAPEAFEVVEEEQAAEPEGVYEGLADELREGAEMIHEAVTDTGPVLEETPEPADFFEKPGIEAAEQAIGEAAEAAAEMPEEIVPEFAEAAEVAPEAAVEPEPAGEMPPAEAEPEAVREEPVPTPEVSDEEVRMWEQALKNKSAVIRKQAAKMLKKLTGKDYDY